MQVKQKNQNDEILRRFAAQDDGHGFTAQDNERRFLDKVSKPDWIASSSPRNDSNIFTSKKKQTTSRNDALIKKLKDKIPIYGYFLSSTMHLISGITSINKSLLPKTFKEHMDKFTVRLSKGITSTYYSLLALEAFKENKTFDFFARLLDPLFVPWMKLEDIHLARGMSAGMTLVDFSQNHKMPKEKQSKKDNLLSNFKAMVEMVDETIKGGLGKERKVFIEQEKDKGHSMALFGNTIMLGSALGVAFGGNKRNLMNKIGGVIRNLGGIMGDITMILHGDKSFRLSGLFYAANAIIDAVQRFLPKDIIDPINHFNMILNNLGTFFYGQISKKRNENTFVDYQAT